MLNNNGQNGENLSQVYESNCAGKEQSLCMIKQHNKLILIIHLIHVLSCPTTVDTFRNFMSFLFAKTVVWFNEHH